MEFSGHNIFILGLMRYDNAIESTNYTIAKHLALQNNVFYFDNPYTYKDCIKLNGTPAYERRRRHLFSPSDGIINTDIPTLKVVIIPPVPSINWLSEGRLYRSALAIAERVILRRMLEVKAQFGIGDLIFINSFNFYYPGIGRKLKPQLSVYHCVDPLVHSYELKHGDSSQAQIAQESDLVICTSRKLALQMSLLNRETYFVPNAADISHSSKALDSTLTIHPLLADIPKPLVGYFGAVERRIDYSMLHELAKLNPDKSFVFTGPIAPEYVPQSCYEMPNVFLTGPVPYDEMPEVLKGFDVAIIPFKKDEVSAAIFPLKLFEYLGAGLPVVATDFNPDLADYSADAVSYCSDAAAFSDAVDDALNKDAAEARAKRIGIAERNTWKHRAAEFGAIINNVLEAKRTLYLPERANYCL